MSVLDLEKQNKAEKFRNYYKPPAPIIGSLEERCIQAVGHIAAGLNCLQFFNENDDNEKAKTGEEEVNFYFHMHHLYYSLNILGSDGKTF